MRATMDEQTGTTLVVQSGKIATDCVVVDALSAAHFDYQH
ncbi:uncharacterized protein METZ01_LOCUS58317 [marine metagenome]|uniref:Uncharacterized protein n=1 Tax=marine metagenome TaxID=408172 RepID=A0A381SVV1_9ZZZZ